VVAVTTTSMPSAEQSAIRRNRNAVVHGDYQVYDALVNLEHASADMLRRHSCGGAGCSIDIRALAASRRTSIAVEHSSRS
jgi:hypothetical protein